jgi:hypothetical protein
MYIYSCMSPFFDIYSTFLQVHVFVQSNIYSFQGAPFNIHLFNIYHAHDCQILCKGVGVGVAFIFNMIWAVNN